MTKTVVVAFHIFRQRVLARDLEAQAFPLGFDGDHRAHVIQQRQEGQRREMKFQLAGFDFREIENVVNHDKQMIAAAFDGGHGMKRLLRQRSIACQHLRIAQNAIQRRAEFVAHVGEKDAFGAVGGFSGFFRVLERFFNLFAFDDLGKQFFVQGREFLCSGLHLIFQMISMALEFGFDMLALRDFLDQFLVHLAQIHHFFANCVAHIGKTLRQSSQFIRSAEINLFV